MVKRPAPPASRLASSFALNSARRRSVFSAMVPSRALCLVAFVALSACGPPAEPNAGTSEASTRPSATASSPNSAAATTDPVPGTAGVRPNVLLVVLDTVRADRLSAYGHTRTTSPNLEALAARGTRFDRALSSAPWTVPAHASILTGLTPAEHGAHHEHRALSPDATTLAEALSSAGYTTAGFSSNPFVGPITRLDQGFARFINIKGGGREVTDRALDFIGETREPWFLMLNYMEDHLPFPGVPDEAVLRFATEAELAQRAATKEPLPAKLLAFEEQFNAFAYSCGAAVPTPERIDALGRLYDGALVYLDSLVGELLAGLAPVSEQTVVIVVSDHGELMGEESQIEHQFSLSDALLRVPLIVSWPGHLPEGAVVEANQRTSAIFDWALAWSEGSRTSDAAPWTLAGRAQAQTETQRSPTEAIFAEYYRPLALLDKVAERYPDCPARLDRRLTALMEGRHKLVMDSRGEARLYDLQSDPAETRDRSRERPEVTARLRAAAKTQQERGANGIDGERPVPAVDPDTRRRLEALGYAGT